MRKDTRFKFNAYLSRVAELNGVDTDDVAKVSGQRLLLPGY